MRRIILLIFGTLLLSSVCAQFVPDKPSQWYSIEPWEVAVCQKWGGRSAPADISAQETGLVGFGPFTYTLLGKKVTLHESNQTLYTYAYYLQSYSAQLTYSIDLWNPSTQQRLALASGTLQPGNGVQDSRSDYLDETFTHLRITHQLGQVLIPFVEADR